MPKSFPLEHRPYRRAAFRFSRRISIATWLLLVCGCSRFRHEDHQYVYVSARQVYLHDRVAAVSNRVGVVTNGEALLVVERGKRFTKIRAPKGEIGWLENHSIIDDKLYAQFEDLDKQHHADPGEAHGVLRDDLYLHLLPGRETAHFLVLPGNTKVELLERGAVAKAAAPGTPVQNPVAAQKPPAPPKHPAPAAPAPAPSTPVASTPILEDWWLVRDTSGHCGWLLARQLDIDVPDEVAIYSEGQRMIAAYPIAKVMDSGVAHEHKAGKKGQKAEPEKTEEQPAPGTPATEHTEYVTVLVPPRGGLPYDFDQLRVFTWSLNHHRYETAYRLHGIHGYLPVRLGQDSSQIPGQNRGQGSQNNQPMPTFSFTIADSAEANITVDAATGVTRPATPRTLSFRLEGNLVRRIGPDLAPIILTHEGEEPGKAKSAGKGNKGKRR